jgi:SAM-dependent methyltransferase
MGSHSAHGYVNDVPYTYHFTRELAPAWLDFVVALSGFEPPSRADGFTWCELGCGQGLTAAIFAGTHPTGEFHGIDAFAPHIDQARRLRERAGIDNLALHAIDFAAAGELELPNFDYIVAHGVYTWIDARGRDDMRQFIDRRLKPGGVVYISYNSMPGWTSDVSFQYLVRAMAGTVAGDSTEQFRAAAKMIDAFTEAGAPALKSSVMATGGLTQLRATLPSNYFAHEFLPPAWQPMYVTQMRADMADLGLVPAGSATIRENFDSFVLPPAARAALETVADPNLRDLVRDYFLNQRFRRDVFVREASRLDETSRDQRLTEMVFDLQRPVEMIECAMDTHAGRLEFESPAARAVIDALRTGPKRIADIVDDSIPRADLLANALALYAAGEIRAAEPTIVDVQRLNAALAAHVGMLEPVRFYALPSGTGVAVDPELTVERREGEIVPPERERWWNFIERYRADVVRR